MHPHAHVSVALHSCKYDVYGLSDHDMAITHRTLQALYREFNRLEGSRYFPGVLRYETLTNLLSVYFFSMSYRIL